MYCFENESMVLFSRLRDDFHRGLTALLNKHLWVQPACLNVPTGAVTSKHPVNTCRDFIRFE
jgi:hypothetical protein